MGEGHLLDRPSRTQAMPCVDAVRMGHMGVSNSATVAASRMPCSTMEIEAWIGFILARGGSSVNNQRFKTA